MKIEFFPPGNLFGLKRKGADDQQWRTGSFPITDHLNHANIENDVIETPCNFFIGLETGFPWYKKRRVKLILIGEIKSKPDFETATTERIFLLFKYEKRKLFL